jgi:hypothetical protein
MRRHWRHAREPGTILLGNRRLTVPSAGLYGAIWSMDLGQPPLPRPTSGTVIRKIDPLMVPPVGHI